VAFLKSLSVFICRYIYKFKYKYAGMYIMSFLHISAKFLLNVGYIRGNTDKRVNTDMDIINRILVIFWCIAWINTFITYLTSFLGAIFLEQIISCVYWRDDSLWKSITPLPFQWITNIRQHARLSSSDSARPTYKLIDLNWITCLRIVS